VTRVALVPSAYLPALGGVEELTRHLARELVRAGDVVEVWTARLPTSTLAAREVMDGITVRRFLFELPAAHIDLFARAVPYGLRTVSEMRRAVAELRPEVLHVQCFGPNGAYALGLSLLARVPLVVTLQGETVMDNDDIFDHSTVLRTALRAAIRRARAVTGCSQFTLDDAERRFGLAPGRGQVVFNGVDVTLAGAAPAGGLAPRLGVQAGRRYVLAVGRIVAKKGFDLLVEAFSRVAAELGDVDLVIGGAGPELEALGALARSRGLEDRVLFPGRLSREEVAVAMAGAAAFVMPSRLEPFGIVALEAWRAGAPLVATSRGGAPEYVHDGIDGVLADPFDAQALASALRQLLEDDQRAQRIGRAGRARVEEFSWSAIAGQYRQIYDAVIAR
jgi:glycosyltransferase involved in cell wall biosynthesis